MLPKQITLNELISYNLDSRCWQNSNRRRDGEVSPAENGPLHFLPSNLLPPPFQPRRAPHSSRRTKRKPSTETPSSSRQTCRRVPTLRPSSCLNEECLCSSQGPVCLDSILLHLLREFAPLSNFTVNSGHFTPLFKSFCGLCTLKEQPKSWPWVAG